MPFAASLLRRPAFVASLLLTGFAAWAATDWYRAEPPTALRQATYVGRESCVRCHQTQAEAFHGSDHDRAMEPATDETVLGDFNDAVFTRFDETTRFFRDGEKFMVNAEGPDGENHDYQVEWTFGVRPLQQYMVKLDKGRVQVLRVAWNVERKEWFFVAPPDAPDLRIEHDDPLHWTGLSQNWNSMCAECHSTDYHKNFDLATNSYNSTYNEIDVSCEACHGPGSAHVELAESRSLFWDRNIGYGLTNSLKTATNVQQVETCAPCHSRRAFIHDNFRAGDSYYDHYDPLLLFPGLYHADGQIQDEVYELASFAQSKMYHQNIKCSDCHDPHSLKLKFDGNQLCFQCHLPGKYDGARHHKHFNSADNAAETQCVTCHMPATTYMEIDGRRDHSIRIPRPDLALELGTPSACGRCHENVERSVEAIKNWYGPKRPDDPHFARAFAAAFAGKEEGDDLLRELARRKTAPAFVRATAVALLEGYPSEASQQARQRALSDESPLVRAAAARAMPDDTPAGLMQRARPLLGDPARIVRLAAAGRLVESAKELADSQFAPMLNDALAEYREAMEMHRDRAESNLALATLAEEMEDIPGAIAAFRATILVEPYRAGPRRELARLLDQVAIDPKLASLRGRIQVDPAEVERLRVEEVELLARDSMLLPNDPELHYRRGMLLYLLNRLNDAVVAFEEAVHVAPGYYDAWMALALVHEKQENWEAAAGAVIEMAQLRPRAQDWQAVRLRLREGYYKWQAEQEAIAPHSESLSPEQSRGVEDDAPTEPPPADDAPTDADAAPD